MATRRRDDVESSLVQKGFELSERDHRYYTFRYENRIVARTKVSRGKKYKGLDDELIAFMARQCHLTNSDFLKLVDCAMSQQDYENSLRQRKLLE